AGIFSPDGRRFLFHSLAAGFLSTRGDLMVYDFEADHLVTLAQNVATDSIPAGAMFLSSTRLVYRTNDPSQLPGSPPAFFGYDFEPGATQSLGDATELVAIPGGALAAFRSDAGPPALIDATFTPRTLPGSSYLPDGQGSSAGFQPSPDGKRLAYVDGGG